MCSHQILVKKQTNHIDIMVSSAAVFNKPQYYDWWWWELLWVINLLFKTHNHSWTALKSNFWYTSLLNQLCIAPGLFFISIWVRYTFPSTNNECSPCKSHASATIWMNNAWNCTMCKKALNKTNALLYLPRLPILVLKSKLKLGLSKNL